MGHTPETRATELAKRLALRVSWLKSHGPCRCGSLDRLELHHRDPAQKIDHRVWSWSEERRASELAKCEPKCYECHREHHDEPRRIHGTFSRYLTGCRCASCVKAKARTQAREQRPRKRRLKKLIRLLQIRIWQLSHGDEANAGKPF